MIITPGPSPIQETSRERSAFFKRPPVFWARLTLGVILIAASVDKIIHPAAFARIIYNYQILPDVLINSAAITLPWLEVLLGGLLLFGFRLPAAVVLTNLLFITFFSMLVFNAARGLNVHCGCFSTSAEGNPVMLWYLARDSVFLLAGGYLFHKVILGNGR